jgi:hypothetical protein
MARPDSVLKRRVNSNDNLTEGWLLRQMII